MAWTWISLVDGWSLNCRNVIVLSASQTSGNSVSSTVILSVRIVIVYPFTKEMLILRRHGKDKEWVKADLRFELRNPDICGSYIV